MVGSLLAIIKFFGHLADTNLYPKMEKVMYVLKEHQSKFWISEDPREKGQINSIIDKFDKSRVKSSELTTNLSHMWPSRPGNDPGQVVEATLPLHTWNIVTLFRVWPSYHWLHWFSSSYLWLYLSVSCFQEQCSWESSFWPLPCSFLVDSSRNYLFLPKLSQLLLKTEICLLAATPKGLHQSYTIYWPDMGKTLSRQNYQKLQVNE